MINLKENNKTPSTSEGSEFRLFTGALILANKFLDDNTFTNKTWANITGISVKEVNYIELQFLQGIGFRLFTRSCDYTEWLASLTHFTGKYMPSQYLVAFQQQTVAALSPISPVDPTTGTPETPLPTPETVAGNLILSTPPPLMHQDRGSGWGSSFGNYSRSTQDQNSYRTEASASLSTGAGAGYSVASTAGPVGAATGSILPHQYTSSVKPAQHRSSFGHRSQRGIPPPTLTTNFLAATTLEKTTPSYHFATSTHPTMNEPREQQPFSYGSYQGSSAPVSAAWTSPSGSSTPHVHARHHYRQQQSRYVDSSLSATRKRSATIAFDEIMDRSPSYEWIGSAANGSAVPSSNSSSLNFSNQSSTSRISHKRVSSSSSMVHMMKELSAGAPTMFQAGYSPVIQSRVNSSHRQHLNRLTATTVPSQRVSTGTMPAPYRGHHHRSASGSHCIGVSEYSAFVHEPSHMATVPSSPQYYVPSQRQFSIKHDGYYTDSVAPALSTKTPPYSSPLSSRKSYNRSNDHYHDLSPSSLMDYRGPEARGMATTENCTEASPYRYEIDPRLWGPLDNLSLYAMTTQAAKRVFAQKEKK
ncbi:hypothetical protein FBU30_006065 [Linnemannia zychae]|nr:hypothetical protein FBU30_006065 [Linnemannia zychae]